VIRRFGAIACIVSLGACSLEPKYVRPEPPVPPSWPVGDAYLRQTEATLPAITYRDVFRDPRLQSLVERALVNNQDLAIAAANVASARALYRVQRANLLPQIDAGARTTVNQNGNNNSGTNTNYTATVGTTGFEIDLFGRIRSLSKAALQTYFGTEAAARSVRLALVGDIASAWLSLATDRSLLAIATETQASATRSVDLTQARLTGGIAPRSDLRQAETVLAQARADFESLTADVAQDRNALDLLVGAPVTDADLPASIESVDTTIAELPAGLDSRILLRRPDVVQAEYTLRAANARIGAARASFFPTISLTAGIGLASSALSSLFSGGAFAWSAAPSATLPLLTFGTNEGNLANANALRERAVAGYRQSIQIAFRDVADALARRGTIERQFAATSSLEAAARDNYALADARYREGIDPFLTSLDSQRTLYNARRSLANTRLLRANSLVALYRALGGDMLVETPPAD
jgi:multidrug efflux system outer membrane protein